MNKVTKVSVGGYSFAFEDAAYLKIKSYLDELESFYSSSSDGKEILEGIEGRLAELLLEKCSKGNVVGVDAVEKAMAILGKPSDIEGTTENKPNNDSAGEEKVEKKLYRDTINKVIGGVCSGLAAYLNVDIALMRILWIVAFLLGMGLNHHWVHFWSSVSVDSLIVLVYCILWICVPPAKTYSDRSRMNGKKGNVDEVQRSVKSGAQAVEAAVRQSDNSGLWRVCWRIVQLFVGVILLIAGTSGLFAGCFAFFGQMAQVSPNIHFALFDIFPGLLTVQSHIWGRILISLVYFIPFIGMIYGGIMIMFELKSPSWKPGLWLFVLWIISLIALAMVLVSYLLLSI